ncbi:hypothetical protein ACJJTC_019864 [Scirpophaga incertulas]
MSGYPYGNPQYPPQYPPQGYLPQQPGQPGQPLYPQVPYGQPGFNYGQPSVTAMSYPGMGAAPSAPMAPGYAPQPNIAPMSVYPGYGQFVEWVPCTSKTAEALTHRAVVAGYEGHDGSPLWVIRARHEGDVIPGKLAIKHKSAYVPWGGKEISVCCAPADRVRWLESRNGTIPPNAIPGGNTTTGETLYIGRAKEQGSLTPGKVHPSHKVLYMSFGGDEIPHQVYEVLCSV